MPAPHVYTHGHHESVLRSHRWRTAENSAGYLLPHLTPGVSLLDVGCGPGTITADLAVRLAPGRVTAVEVTEEALRPGPRRGAGARPGHHRLRGRATCTRCGSRRRHVRRRARPPGAPARRRPGPGAAGDAPGLPARRTRRRPGQRLRRVHLVSAGAGAGRLAGPLPERGVAPTAASPTPGRRLLSWARAAGFTDVTASASTWCFATDEDRRWWGGMWADRILHSDLAGQAVHTGAATEADLRRIVGGLAGVGRGAGRLVRHPARRDPLPRLSRPRRTARSGQRPPVTRVTASSGLST